MSNAKTINIALIGYGFVGKTFHAPLIQSVEGLNLAIVAEGVETPEQAAWLREHGVNFLQGYWISRPMPLEQFRTWQNKVSSQAE